MQLDPMLTPEVVSVGCTAYDIREKENHSPKWHIKNHKRQFRAGIRFSQMLTKRGIKPKRILELGPGCGYFSRALATMIEDSTIKCVDVVESVLHDLNKIHGFQSYHCIPEDMDKIIPEKFDLIIARDILEHVISPSTVIQNCKKLLNPNGYLFILTPNGYEDVWSIHTKWQLKKQHKKLLINHVNYFDGACLLDFIKNCGFSEVISYQYRLKGTLKGKGWKYKHVEDIKDDLTTTVSSIENGETYKPVLADNILPKNTWLKTSFTRKLLALQYRLRHIPTLLQLSLSRQAGHYIFCLVQRKD